MVIKYHYGLYVLSMFEMNFKVIFAVPFFLGKNCKKFARDIKYTPNEDL
jgi:hypothetical protein